jgi:hypothetical protein
MSLLPIQIEGEGAENQTGSHCQNLPKWCVIMPNPARSVALSIEPISPYFWLYKAINGQEAARLCRPLRSHSAKAPGDR